MNLKNYLVVLTLLMLLSACSNKDDEFDGLVAQAQRHYDNSEFTSAAAVYSKALEVKEDPETRNLLNDVNTEIERVKAATSLHNEIKSLAAKYQNVMTSKDIMNTCDEYFDLFAKFESFDTTPRDNATKYIESVRDSNYYHSIKTAAILIQTSYLTGNGKEGPYSDAKTISDKVSELLTTYPLPNGFSGQ